MNKVVIFLLLILAAFSLYLSRVSKEARKVREALSSQVAETQRLENFRKRAEYLEQQLLATQEELARVKAVEIGMRDKLQHSEERLEQLRKQLAEAEQAQRDAGNVRPRLRAVDSES